MVLCEAAPGGLLPLSDQAAHNPSRRDILRKRSVLRKGTFRKRRRKMGEKGGKKDKNKADKQKQQTTEKKKEQQKSKLPSKKPA